jgi:hypothetical protein
MAMTLTNSRATIGLQTRFTPTNTNVQNDIQIGENNENIFLNQSNAIYSLQVFMASASSQFTLDNFTGVVSGATTWVAGTAQVETATASGTISSSGNIAVTITSNSSAVFPKTIQVAVTNGDTTSIWAEKVKDFLSIDPDVSEFFDVSTDGSKIVLTRKPLQTIVGSNNTFPFYDGNDSSLNVEILGGSTGASNVITSTNTTAGVATSGCLVLDGDGKDVEGNTIGTISTTNAALFKMIGGGFTIDNGFDFYCLVGENGHLFVNQFVSSNPIVITASAAGWIQITIIGTIE